MKPKDIAWEQFKKEAGSGPMVLLGLRLIETTEKLERTSRYLTWVLIVLTGVLVVLAALALCHA